MLHFSVLQTSTRCNFWDLRTYYASKQSIQKYKYICMYVYVRVYVLYVDACCKHLIKYFIPTSIFSSYLLAADVELVPLPHSEIENSV